LEKGRPEIVSTMKIKSIWDTSTTYSGVNVSSDRRVLDSLRAGIDIVTSISQGEDAESRNEGLKGFHDEKDWCYVNEGGEVGLGSR
jgi:hypothetical protein